MCELAAQVTSGLLQFPEVTIEALADDESTQDEGLYGKIAAGRNGLSWLACGAHLELLNSVTGERLSAYRFRGIGEQPPTILAIKEFCWLKRTGLLIGLKESEGSILCLYDLAISRVVKAVFLPGKVTAIEPIVNHGGATASTQRLHQSLRWFFGIIAVVTDTGHVLLIDLCLDDFSCSQSEQEPADLEVVNRSPGEIPQMRETVMREGRHLCFQLQSPSAVAATAMSYVPRTNQLVVGFANGYVQLWNLKTLKKEYYSQLEGGKVPVYAFTFQEPENDPRNCCYLWAVQSAQDGEGDVVSLHLLQLAFGDRKCLTSGQILYEGLEYCEERYTQDLTYEAFSSRTSNTNARLLGCQTIEKFRNHGDREESVTEASSPDTSVSIFSWQVNTYGQRRPSTYLGIFDINRWYHAQMPDSLRAGEQLHNCPYFALWSLDAIVCMTFPYYLLDVLVHERSLSRGVPPSYPPPEQFFNPSTYNFDATCLVNSGLVHMTCSGFQKETLNYLKKTGPFLSEAIPDGYSRCLMAGLLSPRLADVQPSCLTQEEKLEAILSAAVESSSLGLITGCIKQWTAEEQPRSAASLRFVLEWTWKKITRTKEELDNICIPLFDGSCHFIDPHTLQSLQHCQMLLSNLTTIVSCFLTEAQELTERGLVDLMNKRLVGTLLSQYTQVVLWFCRAGLLPEGSDDVDVLQLSRPIYNYPIIQNYYTSRRHKLGRLSKGRWCSDCLLIDGMVSETGDCIEHLWKRDEGGTGKYPPSTLHALLDVYLLENVDETTKHAIAIYLLLDVLSSTPNKNESSIESFPPAFAVPVGLVNLIQGFWLLDHSDHENALDRILHPATSRSLSSWQHVRIIQALMCQGEHRKALRYMQAMKPSMASSSEVKLHLTVLLFNRCMVEAWHLLRLNANRINVEDLLKHMYELCQENGLMEELLKLPFTATEQECLEKFLKKSGSLQNQEYLLVHHLQRANYVPALQLNQSLKINLNDHDPHIRERTAARNSILEQYGKVLPRLQRRLATERAKPYHHLAILREVTRPKPLSTVARLATSGSVVTRATFINSVLSKVNEVWQKNEQESTPSPHNSPRNNEPPSVNPAVKTTEVSNAFVGTPINRQSKRLSRILDSVRQLKTHSSLNAESTPCAQSTASPSWMTTNPLQPYTINTGHLGGISKASELKLLQTPPVMKRARAFTSSETTFANFTPQSILRSNLRPTPLTSPCASPSRSSTPPLRAKETKISFMKEKPTIHWTNGVAAADELQLLASSGHIPRTPSVESWPSTTENQATPDNEVLSEQVEMVDLSGTDMDDDQIQVPKDNIDSSGRTEELSVEEYVDAAESLDRGDTSKEMGKEVSADAFSPSSGEKTLTGDPPCVEKQIVEEGATLDQEPATAQTENEHVPANENLFDKSDIEQTSECKEVLDIDAIKYCSPSENVTTAFITSDNEEAALLKYNLEYAHEGEGIHPDMPEGLQLSRESQEKDGLFQNEELPVTAEGESSTVNRFVCQGAIENNWRGFCSEIQVSGKPEQKSVVMIVDGEGIPDTQTSEENESVLLRNEESDVEIVHDNAAFMLEEPLTALLPVSTQHLQDVDDGFEAEPTREAPWPVTSAELEQHEPVVFVTDNGSDIAGQSYNTIKVASEADYEVDEVVEQHNIQENFTLILEDNDEDEPVELLTSVETNQQPPSVENEKIIPLESMETKISEPNKETREVSTFESEEQACTKNNSLVLQEPLEDQCSLAEALPYLTEPIKVAKTDNSIEVLKVGQSDVELSELISLPVQVDTPVINERSGLFKSQEVKKAQTDKLEEIVSKVVQTKEVATPTRSSRSKGNKVTNGNALANEELVLVEIQKVKPKIEITATPRRSTRRTVTGVVEILKNNFADPKNVPLDQRPDSVHPTSGSSRKAKTRRSSVMESLLVAKIPLTPHTETVPVLRATRRSLSIRAGTEHLLHDPLRTPLSQQADIVPISHCSTKKKNRKLSEVHAPLSDRLSTFDNEQMLVPPTPSRLTRSRAKDAHLVALENIAELNSNVEVTLPADSQATRKKKPVSSKETPNPIAEDDIEDDGQEEQLTVTFTHKPTRRRPSKGCESQAMILAEEDSYTFSPPLTRSSKKTKVQKAMLPDSPAKQPPEFSFSTPLTRSRRKTGKALLPIVEEQDFQELEDDVPKVREAKKQEGEKTKTHEEKMTTRTRTTRLRVKKSPRITKKVLRSAAPPVHIEFLSPLASPLDARSSKRGVAEEVDAGSVEHKMKLRHKRKKLIPVFRKPVTRRKVNRHK
ncbi:protein ELYS isoform X1 [Scyliorhinus canicula]|uniref:protein ELYS isoform X1 n=1 Tax=Scyliorhinus canicula TaxID=7830 RepID=UPI0018F3E6C3|nr:protein ELYS isoform X1 [Scyliorhinus canicula]XP_038671315.1 protein ELYS isoform X1 [Scyliorhinus canicula]XP_038671320.1 protein ELYS isoform X1 [Scyliorhinus canicula]XP_038671326.1 protein ELYS isoform X1 [Scyliorhinus canicula]